MRASSRPTSASKPLWVMVDAKMVRQVVLEAGDEAEDAAVDL
mgnify:CR=1 FL=1